MKFPTDMLQALEYNAIDQKTPFFGEIVDTCSGNSKSAPVAEVSTANVDLLNRVYRRRTEVELMESKRPINNFKRMTRAVFGPSQASSMAT